MRPTARGARRVVGSAAPCPTSRFVISGGERGIRTHGTLTGTPDFESGTFGHSVSSPPRNLPSPRRIVKRPRAFPAGRPRPGFLPVAPGGPSSDRAPVAAVAGHVADVRRVHGEVREHAHL